MVGIGVAEGEDVEIGSSGGADASEEGLAVERVEESEEAFLLLLKGLVELFLRNDFAFDEDFAEAARFGLGRFERVLDLFGGCVAKTDENVADFATNNGVHASGEAAADDVAVDEEGFGAGGGVGEAEGDGEGGFAVTG